MIDPNECEIYKDNIWSYLYNIAHKGANFI
jgi:hypothetical protein